jgi:hypothetical protein
MDVETAVLSADWVALASLWEAPIELKTTLRTFISKEKSVCLFILDNLVLICPVHVSLIMPQGDCECYLIIIAMACYIVSKKIYM